MITYNDTIKGMKYRLQKIQKIQYYCFKIVLKCELGIETTTVKEFESVLSMLSNVNHTHKK